MPRPISTMSWGGSKIQLPRVRPKACCRASKQSTVSECCRVYRMFYVVGISLFSLKMICKQSEQHANTQ